MSEEQEGTTIPGEQDPAEARAAGNGWQPLEQWVEAGKDAADWVDAREFNVRGELMGKIQGMGRKLSGLEQENARLREAQKQHANVTKLMVERQYEKALADLKKERRDALEVGDYDTLEELDSRRDDLVAKKAEYDKTAEDIDEVADTSQAGFDVSKMHPIERTFLDVVASDPTLRTNSEKAKEVGQMAQEIWDANPEISTTEFIRKLDQRRNPTREPAPSGPGRQSAGSRPTSGKKYTKNDLSEMELEFAKTFVDTGAYKSVQDYIDDLAKGGALEIQQR